MIVARSASDKTDDWPYWMVWDGTKNVTAKVFDAIGFKRAPGVTTASREACEEAVRLYTDSTER